MTKLVSDVDSTEAVWPDEVLEQIKILADPHDYRFEGDILLFEDGPFSFRTVLDRLGAIWKLANGERILDVTND